MPLQPLTHAHVRQQTCHEVATHPAADSGCLYLFALIGACQDVKIDTMHASRMIDLADNLSGLSLVGAVSDKYVVENILSCMDYKERFNCALVCRIWAKAATAVTSSVILHRVNDLSNLQQWLAKYGSNVHVLHLHSCQGPLTALPCPQLHDLVLDGRTFTLGFGMSWPKASGWMPTLTVAGSVWNDIAAATKLTSVSLAAHTAAQQADIEAVVTALPQLKRLIWGLLRSSSTGELLLLNPLLPQLIQLTALELATSVAQSGKQGPLQQLVLLTNLQWLSIEGDVPSSWYDSGSFGLQSLKSLTYLHLEGSFGVGFPRCISQLTALGELKMLPATRQYLDTLQLPTGLTSLCVRYFKCAPTPTPLHLPILEKLELCGSGTFRVSNLQHSTALLQLSIEGLELTGPGSLAACRNLQRLDLRFCKLDHGASDASPWALLFPGSGQLPQLTSVQVYPVDPPLQLGVADLEELVTCCSSLHTFELLLKTTIPPSAQPGALQHLDNLSALPLDLEDYHYFPLQVNCTALPLLRELSATTECTVLFPEGLNARSFVAIGSANMPQQPQLEDSSSQQ